MKTNQQIYAPRFLSKSALILLAAVILLGSSQNALAQWTTNGNNTTTPNNVGIGTTTPDKPFVVQEPFLRPGSGFWQSSELRVNTMALDFSSTLRVR